VRGWRLAYVRCGTHGHRHMILISPAGELTWVTNQHKHVNEFEDCVWHAGVFPLGGWTKQPHLHIGHPHNVAYEIRNTYMVERFWTLGKEFKIEFHHDTVTASLQDCDGSRLVADIWFLLRLVYEDRCVRNPSRDFYLPHLHYVFLDTWRERDEARLAVNELFVEMMVAEEKVQATKRFVKSKQGLEIRAWLLNTLYAWMRRLAHEKIRDSSKIDEQALLDRAIETNQKLTSMQEEVLRLEEIRRQANPN